MPIKQQTQKKNIKKKKTRTPMSEQTKTNIRKYTGVVLWVIGLALMVGMLAYLFSWKADQSALAAGGEVVNAGGTFGHSIGYFLICRCFGLASFGILYLLFVLGRKMFYWTEHHHTLKKILLSSSAVVLGGWILSYFSRLFSSDTVFGGGLGGYASAAVIEACRGTLGQIVTGLFLAVLLVVWLLFASDRFAEWFSHLGDKKPKSDVVEDDVLIPAEHIVTTGDSDSDNIIDPENEETEDDKTDTEEIIEVPVEEQDVQEDMENTEVGGLSEVDDSTYGIGADGELPRIDQRQEDAPKYKFPSLDLLNDYADSQHTPSSAELDDNNKKIRIFLSNYKIGIDDITASIGPTVTLYKIFLSPGFKVSAVEGVSRELAMTLGVNSVRVVTLHNCVGIEVPNSTPSIVPLKSMLNDDSFRNSKAELPVAIGYTITKQVKTFDLTKSPHLLIAGATMQGKSVGLNVIIASLLYAKHPSELKFVFVDPKMVEFSAYNGLLKHYLAVLPTAANEEDERDNAIIKTPNKAKDVLNSLCVEMDERYRLLANSGVNSVKLYNEKYKNRYLRPDQGHHYLPYLVVVIDEYADLTMAGGSSAEARKAAREIMDAIIRLAQKGRAAGIHVIIATQRPSVDVISGRIKTNFPARIAFRVVQGSESQIILDVRGAENLIGNGDMLYKNGTELERVQCAYISGKEIEALTGYISEQTKFGQACSLPYYLPEPPSDASSNEPGSIDMTKIDPLLLDAAHIVVVTQKGSTSDLQRRLGVGYARAGRIMDQLEGAGIVGPQDGSKPRQVLVDESENLTELLAPFMN